MRAKEFLSERTGKHDNNHASVHTGVSKGRDPGGFYPSYHQLRTGIALAMADGTNNKLNVDHESWMGPFWTQHPYTEEEHNMFKQVRKAVPTEHHQVLPYEKSAEPDDTHKVSPVAKHKKNKYGI
jgi:hypothetical protein